MTPEEKALQLVADVITKSKNIKKGTIPEYTDIYKDSVENKLRVKHHAYFGEYPEKLFAVRAPNQTDTEAKYLKANYKCNTNSVFIDYMSTINRMWNDGNWSIKWKEGTDEEIKTYFEKKIPVYISLENFYKNVLPKVKATDAMAVLAHKPYKLPTKTNEQGEIVIDGAILPEIYPVIFDSCNVIYFDNEEYLFVENYEKSIVTFGGREVKEGRVFEYYDKNAIYKVIQYGVKSDNKFKVELFWQHNLGYLPCERLKGIPEIDEGNIIYQSPFLFVCDLLDDALLDFNQMRLSKSAVVFPQRYMYGDACDYTDNKTTCIDGKITQEDGSFAECPQCNGTGVKSRLSPLGVLIIKGSDKFTEGDASLKGSPIGYVEPSTNALDFLQKCIDKSISQARKMLHLNDSTSNSTSNPSDTTAVHTSTELKAMYSFIQQVANETFDLFSFSYKCIGEMRYGSIFIMPEIRYPKSFDLRTDEDYTREITEAINNKMPSFVIYSLIYSYIQNRFNTQSEAINIYRLIMLADRLVTMNTEDINSISQAADWEKILHESSMTFLNELILENQDFLMQDIDKQVIALQDKAKQKAIEIKPVALTLEAVAGNK